MNLYDVKITISLGEIYDLFQESDEQQVKILLFDKLIQSIEGSEGKSPTKSSTKILADELLQLNKKPSPNKIDYSENEEVEEDEELGDLDLGDPFWEEEEEEIPAAPVTKAVKSSKTVKSVPIMKPTISELGSTSRNSKSKFSDDADTELEDEEEFVPKKPKRKAGLVSEFTVGSNADLDRLNNLNKKVSKQEKALRGYTPSVDEDEDDE